MRKPKRVQPRHPDKLPDCPRAYTDPKSGKKSKLAKGRHSRNRRVILDETTDGVNTQYHATKGWRQRREHA